jgi:osmoprotectant transport system permease protein
MKTVKDRIIQYRGLAPQLIYLILFLLWIFKFPELLEWASPWLPERAKILSRTPLYVLAAQHIIIAFVSTGLAIATALTLGISVRLFQNKELKSIILTASAIGETIPSAAIIALSVPILGYGNIPIILALYLYAILPIIRNVIVGFESTSPAIIDAGIGLGMSRLQLLWFVDLPMAKPIIMAGIRMALVINISAATIGATVGAGGFGVPIISGIRIYDPIMVIQGSIPVLLLALFSDRLLRETHKTEA